MTDPLRQKLEIPQMVLPFSISEDSTTSHGPLKPVRNLVMLLTGMMGNAVPG